MPIHRLNHAVLYVRDAERSAQFYEEVLGFRQVMAFPGAVFLQAEGSTNDHDLGLFSIGEGAAASGAGRQTVGPLPPRVGGRHPQRSAEIGRKLSEVGALSGATDHGTTKALYAKDPDGLDFEISWLVPADLLSDDIEVAAGDWTWPPRSSVSVATPWAGSGSVAPDR